MATLTNISETIKLMNAYDVQVIGKMGTYKSEFFGEKDAIASIAFLNKEGNIIMKERFSANTCVLYDEKISEKLECLCWYLVHEKVDSYDCEKLMEKLERNNLELFCHIIKNRIKQEHKEKHKEKVRKLEEQRKEILKTKILLFCNENGLNLYEHNLNYYIVKFIDKEVKKPLDMYGIESYINFMHNHPDNPQVRIVYEGEVYCLEELESFYDGLQELSKNQ